jgi:iron-sulfur cluster repair protein YtfE (RIC family)
MAVVAGAVGLMTGLAARAGARSLAEAAEPLVAGHWLDMVKADHLVILDLFDRARATRDRSKAKRGALLARIKAALARHAQQEEAVLYPALRFSDAAQGSALLAADHAEINAALFDIERLPAGDPNWTLKMAALHKRLEDHMRREEEELFLALRRSITPEEDARLTQLVTEEGRRFV